MGIHTKPTGRPGGVGTIPPKPTPGLPRKGNGPPARRTAGKRGPVNRGPTNSDQWTGQPAPLFQGTGGGDGVIFWKGSYFHSHQKEGNRPECVDRQAVTFVLRVGLFLET